MSSRSRRSRSCGPAIIRREDLLEFAVRVGNDFESGAKAVAGLPANRRHRQLRIEYHPADDGPGTKTPDEAVTVDLTTRKLAHFQANDLGHAKAARAIRAMR